MHPYRSVPYTILETFPPTCARYFLFMLSGLGSACGRAAQTAGTAPALESPPAKRGFTGFNYPWGSHHGGGRVVTSGFTPTSVLVPPELLTSLLQEHVLTCVLENWKSGALGVVFRCCEGSVGCAGTKWAEQPLLGRGASVPWGPSCRGDSAARACVWAGKCHSDTARMEMVHSGNAAVTSSRNPRAPLARGAPQRQHRLPTPSSTQTRGFQQTDHLPPPRKNKVGKKAFAGSHVPFALQTVITAQTHRLSET